MTRRKRTRTALRRLSIFVGVLLLGAVAVTLARFHVPDDYPVLGAVQRALGVGRAPYQDQRAKHVAAHRGYGSTDNTERSIRNAIGHGATVVEIDVRWCGGQWILFHDATTVGLPGGAEGQAVAPLALDELRAMQGRVDPDERILSLDDALGRLASQVPVWLIDIKDTGHVPELVSTLGRHGISPKDGSAILLGGHEILGGYTELGFPLAYCAGFTEGDNGRRFLLGHRFLLDRCEALDSGSNLKHLVLPGPFLRRSLVEEARSRGLEVWVYAVVQQKDPAREYRNWLALGVDGLIVDHLPEAMSLRGDGVAAAEPD